MLWRSDKDLLKAKLCQTRKTDQYNDRLALLVFKMCNAVLQGHRLSPILSGMTTIIHSGKGTHSSLAFFYYTPQTSVLYLPSPLLMRIGRQKLTLEPEVISVREPIP